MTTLLSPRAITALIVLVVLALAWELLSRWRRPELLHYGIGATAGLQSEQLAHVHVFTIFCVLAALFDRQKPVPGRQGRRVFLFGIVGIMCLSTPLGTFVNDKTLAVQLLVFALCAGFVTGRATPEATHRMLVGLYGMCVVGAMVAIGEKLGAIPYTPFVDQSGARIPSIYHEPDWLGLYSAVGLLLAVVLPFSGRRWHQAVTASCLMYSLLISGARAAWLALGVTLVIMAIAQNRDDRRRTTGVLLAGALAAAIAVAIDPAILAGITTRLGGATGQLSAVERYAQQAALRHLASTAPWHGLGLSASGHVTPLGVVDFGPSNNNVASNWILGWWVDAKYLALPVMVTFIALALATFRRTSGQLLLLVLINSLYSNATVSPIFWLAVGLAAADVPLGASSMSRQPMAARPPENAAQDAAPARV